MSDEGPFYSSTKVSPAYLLDGFSCHLLHGTGFVAHEAHQPGLYVHIPKPSKCPRCFETYAPVGIFEQRDEVVHRLLGAESAQRLGSSPAIWCFGIGELLPETHDAFTTSGCTLFVLHVTHPDISHRKQPVVSSSLMSVTVERKNSRAIPADNSEILICPAALIEVGNQGDYMGLFNFTKNMRGRGVEDSDVQNLIDSLREGNNRNVRREARIALVGIGNGAVPQLLSALGDQDWRVREEATKALGEIGNPRTAAHLIRMFCDEKTRIQLWATDSLIGMGNEVVNPLLEALNDPDRRIRMGAIVTLGEIGDKRVVPILEKSLTDADSRVSEAAREAIDAIEESA
jgi:bilin biosynthesis protein